MATRTSSVASNFACETLLSKSSDSTTGISGVAGSTAFNKASAYVINSGDDLFPVIQGIARFNAAPLVPAGLLQSTPLTITAQANGTTVNLLSLFPAGANGTYMLAFQNNTNLGQSVSAVGRIVTSASAITELDGFNASMVQPALVGGDVSVVQITSNGSSSIGLYNASGVAVTGFVALYKIASSN
jgi:hypothetical protein